VTLRHDSRLLHIAIGRAHAGRRVVLLVDDLDVRVVADGGTLIRRLTIEPSRNYQPLGTSQLSTVSRDICLRCLATSQSGP